MVAKKKDPHNFIHSLITFMHYYHSKTLHTYPIKLFLQIQNANFFFTNLHLPHFHVHLHYGTQLIIVNNCKESIWPGILGSAGHQTPQDGGFHLYSGEQVSLQLPENWSGRIWGRQGCCFDQKTGKGSCLTGDCAGLLHCRGIGGVPPATVVEMTLGTSKSSLHYYDVSLVDGFNVPVSMSPIGGGVGCGLAACEADVNKCCPSALEMRRGGKVVGCKSACLASKSDKYCCTGQFASRQSCKPTVFSRVFKAICPRAYSYAYDDSTSLKVCKAPRYVITFCPPN
ncbi:thaumatin-like protein isoform X1 [Ziziphus jujuba]|uniref:Thaumatin-like protein isoform X1 n=1 Tax=Ziziphus jujuba TaxID=326968 RepID=A0A6P3ZDC2_ZIZJJ|nr:thaumatin-like protein isoform X1 [Ziziphus jujuba]